MDGEPGGHLSRVRRGKVETAPERLQQVDGQLGPPESPAAAI
jgi:hypothetical protein